MESQEQRLEWEDNPGSKWLCVVSRQEEGVLTGALCLHLTYLLRSYLPASLILSFGTWSIVASLAPSTL